MKIEVIKVTQPDSTTYFKVLIDGSFHTLFPNEADAMIRVQQIKESGGGKTEKLIYSETI